MRISANQMLFSASTLLVGRQTDSESFWLVKHLVRPIRKGSFGEN